MTNNEKRAKYLNPIEIIVPFVMGIIVLLIGFFSFILYKKGFALISLGITILFTAPALIALLIYFLFQIFHKYKNRDLLLNKLKSIKGNKVLDFGTGKGFLAIKLAKAGYTVTGEDVVQSSLEQARKNALIENVDVELVYGDQNGLGMIKDDEYEIVTSHIVFHMCKDKNKMLREIKRVMKTGGSLIMIDFRRGIGAFCMQSFGSLHITKRNELINLLKNNGFKNISVKNLGYLFCIFKAEK